MPVARQSQYHTPAGKGECCGANQQNDDSARGPVQVRHVETAAEQQACIQGSLYCQAQFACTASDRNGIVEAITPRYQQQRKKKPGEKSKIEWGCCVANRFNLSCAREELYFNG